MIKTFEIGKTYQTRSIGDHDCIFSFEVLKRTSKTIAIKENGKISTKKVSIKIEGLDDIEICYPLGKYSMAPVIRADRELV